MVSTSKTCKALYHIGQHTPTLLWVACALLPHQGHLEVVTSNHNYHFVAVLNCDNPGWEMMDGWAYLKEHFEIINGDICLILNHLFPKAKFSWSFNVSCAKPPNRQNSLTSVHMVWQWWPGGAVIIGRFVWGLLLFGRALDDWGGWPVKVCK